MNRRTALAILAIFAAACGPAARAGAADEAALVGVLQSDKPVGEKVAACRDLKVGGTAKAVPALAALLADKDLSYWARYALESMPCAEAGAALREALPKVAGLLKVGVIDSLGDRGDREAVPALVELVKDADAQIASAAATALGKIGGPEAVAALEAARAKAAPAVRPAVADALLLAADRCLAAGDAKAASAIYQAMYDADGPVHVRTAAYRGLVRAAGDGAVALAAKGVAGEERAAQLASLQMVREIPGEAATRAFADLLAKVPPATQAALVEALAQRGDPAARPAVVAAAASPAPAVRMAALAALGVLGDASTATLLAETAAKATGDEQEVAREALTVIRDPKVYEVLLAALPKADPAVQAEMARAMGLRQETQAVPALLKMAGPEADEATRLVALRSLGMLADASAADELVQIVLRVKSDAAREAAEQALVTACGRSDRPEARASRVLAAMKGADTAGRASLLRVAGRVGGPEALQALRAGLADKEAAVRDAALRTMAEAAGPEAAPDLLKLAREADGVAPRVLALRGYWRLVAAAADRPVDERWKMCEAAMAASQRPEEKRLGLKELAKVGHPGALRLAESLCADEAVRGEAEAACVGIAAALAPTRPAEAKAALQRVASSTKNANLRAEAAKALDAMDQYVGYLTAWLVAGPYREQGKECTQLFDVAFPPEKPDAKDVAWKPLPPPADPALIWQADLGGIVGGDHCVAYLKTRVFSPAARKVRLDIGTDDGIKLWVNGKLVHANNAVRGLTPGADKAEAELREGWNDFFVKITQHTMGCGACIRVRGTDGAILDGLRCDPAAKP